jgi:ankyrin repeat protein
MTECWIILTAATSARNSDQCARFHTRIGVICSLLAKGNEDLTQLLLDAGSIIDTKNYNMESAPSKAARNGRGSIVRHLLETDPAARQKKRFLEHTSQVACKGNHEDILQDLILFSTDECAEDVISSALKLSFQRDCTGLARNRSSTRSRSS